MLELSLVLVELAVCSGALRRVLLLLQQALALVLELLPALLDGRVALLALLARLLERRAELLELGCARRRALRLELLAELAQGLFGVVQPLVRQRLSGLARQRALLELARHALQTLFEGAAVGLEILAEIALDLGQAPEHLV